MAIVPKSNDVMTETQPLNIAAGAGLLAAVGIIPASA